jgi:hypothetical protein
MLHCEFKPLQNEKRKKEKDCLVLKLQVFSWHPQSTLPSAGAMAQNLLAI